MIRNRKTVRWGVVGCGNIAEQEWIPALKQVKHCSLAAVLDIDGRRARALAGKFKVPRYYARADDFFKEDLDAVYIATPNNSHCALTVQAAQAGWHVLCEKPMAVSARECEAMIAACARHDVRLMIAYMSRFQPAIIKARQAIAAGLIGRPYVGVGHFSYIFPPKLFSRWRMHRKFSGGGCFMDIGVYLSSTLRLLLGAPEESILACAKGAKGTDCEVFAGAMIRYRNGATGVLECGFETALRSGVEIRGDQGLLFVERPFERSAAGRFEVRLGEGGERVRKYALPIVNPYRQEIEHFLECIRTNQQPWANGPEGLRDVKVAEFLYKSAASKKEEKVK